MADWTDIKTKIIAPVVVLAAMGIFMVMAPHKESPLKVEGTIARLDAAQGRATLEFRHHRNGQLTTVTAAVPPECEIHLNNQPAKLGDLQVGDKAVVQVLYRKKRQEIRVLGVKAERVKAAASEQAKQ